MTSVDSCRHCNTPHVLTVHLVTAMLFSLLHAPCFNPSPPPNINPHIALFHSLPQPYILRNYLCFRLTTSVRANWAAGPAAQLEVHVNATAFWRLEGISVGRSVHHCGRHQGISQIWMIQKGYSSTTSTLHGPHFEVCSTRERV